MIKNTLLKKVLKESIFKVITTINRVLPKDDKVILLYMGNKGLGFNLSVLFDYMIEKGINDRYKIICSVESSKYFGDKLKNVEYVDHVGGLMWYLKASHVFYTAGQLPIKPKRNQTVIHLNHGITDYKTVGALTKINNGDEFFFTYMIASSPLYIPITVKEYLCSEDNVIVCNEPMTERILKPQNEYDFSEYDKVLLWAPTFRQSDYLGYDDSSVEDLIPLFDESMYGHLNRILKEKNILLIVKLHPSQTIKNYNYTSFSHLKIYSHDDFISSGMNLYDLMAQADGMLGDYSSASLQFLLTDKPIAYVIPDFDEYKEKRGFVFEDPKQYMPGHLIYTIGDFETFLEDFSQGRDDYAQERLNVKNLIHKYQDTKSCERLLAFSHISLND